MTDKPVQPGLHHGSFNRKVTGEQAALQRLPTSGATRAVAGVKPTWKVNIGGGKGGGFFDRMFKGGKPFTAPDDKLLTLANAMKETDPNDAALDNPGIPAGYTYLGQFVDHDITLDTTPLSTAMADLGMVENFRSPGIDLDSVYGSGPGPHRFLFARERVQGKKEFRDTSKLLLGKTEVSPDQNGVDILPDNKDNDLPRNPQGAAIIGDHRNDENLLVAQTHVAFLKFHNKVVDELVAANTPRSELFDKASRIVRWHYQWMVLHDLVARLTEPGTVNKVLTEGRKFYRFKKQPYMPFEFSAALFRLGHSMVREVYSHNRVFPSDSSGITNGTLRLLFNFSGLSGLIGGDIAFVPPPPPPPGPPSTRLLPTNWIVDWRRFYDFSGVPLNLSRRLDPLLAPMLHTLPGESGTDMNLAFRNLKRGVRLQLPSGQAVAEVMSKKIAFTALTSAEIASGADGAVAKSLGFHTDTPLWYYILKEAQVRHQGLHLGPVGSRLLAEVFVGLVQGGEDTFLSDKAPKNWKPHLKAKSPGNFTMTDLLNFVGEVSPIDGVATA